MIAAGHNYLKYLITGDASQLKKELADAQQGINNLGSGSGSNMRTVSGQMDAMAMSAKQLTAATRGLPAQFTDIFVSLQGGQAPLTVLLQQGGQLKDMFGGIGPAAKAMGGYIMGLVNPYSLAAAAVLALGVAYYQGSQEQDAWNKTIATTGNAMGVTTSQLRSYAQQLDGVVGTQHAAAAGLNDMLAAGVAGGAQLRDYTQAAMAWESATGQAVSETAKQFKSLAADPLQAVLKLNESTNFLTLDLYEQIKALDEQGRSTEAARLAQDAYAGTLNERSSQIKDNLGVLEKAWNGITGAARKAWDAMLNIGRPATLEDQLSEVEKQLEVALANQSWGETGGGAATGRVTTAYQKQVQEEIKVLKEKRWALMDQIDAQHLSAVASSENAKAVAAQAEWDKIVISNLDKQAKMERELASVREAAAAAGITGVELESQLAAVREKYAEKTKKASTATKTAYESLIVAINEKRAAADKELSQGEKLTEFEKLRLRYQQELATRGRAFTAQQRADIEARLAAGEATERQAIAERELAKALEEDQKALERLQQQREKQLQTLEGNLKKLQLEEEAHAYAAAAGITHAEAVERLTISRMEEHLAMARQGAESQSTIDWLERELAVRQQIAQAMGQKGVREANEKVAKEATKTWEKTSQLIGDTLSDYIMGGGKDAATYLKRLFSTLVLQPVVQTVVGGIMGTGTAAASGAGAGMMDRLANSGGGFTNWSSWGATSSDWLIDQSTDLAVKGFGELSKHTYNLGETIQGVDNWLKDIPGFDGGIGSVFGYGQAVYALTEGNYGQAIGTAIGTYILPGIGTMIGSTLGSLVDGMFGGGTPHAGAAAEYYQGGIANSGKSYTKAAANNAQYTAALQGSINGVAQAVGGAFDAMAALFNQQAGYKVATGFTADGDDKSHGLFRVTNAEGEQLIQWLAKRSGEFGSRATGYGYSSDSEKGYDQYLASVTAATIPLLKDIVPAWADGMLDGLVRSLGYSGDAKDWKSIASGSQAFESLNAVIQQIVQVEAAFKSLGNAMSMFSGISDEMKTALLGGLGGIEGLTQAAGAYYQSYYTEAERMQHLREQVNSALSDLGVAPLNELDAFGANAKERFRAELEHVAETGQGEIMAAMLALAPSFAAAAEYAEKLDGALGGLSDVMLDLLDERKSLEAELLRAQGDEAGYLAAMRAIATEGYSEAEIAAWDYNTALQSQIDATYAASEALQKNARTVLQSHISLSQEYVQALQQQISEAQSKLSQLSSNSEWAMTQAGRAYGQSGVESTQFFVGFAKSWEEFAGSMGALHDAFAGLEKAQQAEIKKLEDAKKAEEAQVKLWQDILNVEQQQVAQMMSLEQAIQTLQGAVVDAVGSISVGAASGVSPHLSQPGSAGESAAIAAGAIQNADGTWTMKSDTSVHDYWAAIYAGQADAAWRDQVRGHKDWWSFELLKGGAAIVGSDANRAAKAIIAEIEDAVRGMTDQDAVDKIALAILTGQRQADSQGSGATAGTALPEMTIAEYQQLANMQMQYWRLLGDEESIRKATLAAMHPQLQAMQEQLWLVEAQQAQLTAFNNALGGLVDTGYDLETDLLRLRGDEVGALARERARDLEQLFEGIEAADMRSQIAAQYDRNQALRDEAKALQEAQAASELAIEKARSGAWANLDAAVEREKTYWQEIADASQEAISSLSSTLDLLTSNAKDLYGTVDSSAQMQAVQGMLYVENALAAVRAGADVTGFDGLSDAISAARGGIDSGRYASALDRDLDALVLAGQLTELGELTDDQLSIEQRALKAAQEQIDQLDATLEYWRQQLEGTHTLIDKTLSVEAAVQALAATIAAQSAAQTAAVAAALAQAGTYAAQAGTYAAQAGAHAAQQTVSEAVAITDAEVVSGSSSSSGGNVSALMQRVLDARARQEESFLVQTRAKGGYTPAGLTLVGEEGPELVNFRSPSMVYTAAQTANLLGGRSDTARLEALVESLTEEVARLNTQVNTLKTDGRKSREVLEGMARGEYKQMEAA